MGPILLSYFFNELSHSKNPKDLVELLISKVADINAKDIIYQIIKIKFLINLI